MHTPTTKIHGWRVTSKCIPPLPKCMVGPRTHYRSSISKCILPLLVCMVGPSVSIISPAPLSVYPHYQNAWLNCTHYQSSTSKCVPPLPECMVELYPLLYLYICSVSVHVTNGDAFVHMDGNITMFYSLCVTTVIVWLESV